MLFKALAESAGGNSDELFNLAQKYVEISDTINQAKKQKKSI